MMQRTRRISGWIALRGELPRQGLISIGTQIMSAAPIVLGVMGPLTVGLVAMVALPPLYAVTRPLVDCIAIVAAHSLIAAVPQYLMRQRVLPVTFLAWSMGLPIPWQTRLLGHAWATSVAVAPLFAAYVLSLLVWIWQSPTWLRETWNASIAALLTSMLGTWLLGMLTLMAREHLCHANRRAAVPGLPQCHGRAWREAPRRWPRDLVIARDLLLRSVWRQRSWRWSFGHPLLIVLSATCIAGLTLTDSRALVGPATFALIGAMLFVVIALWRDSAIQGRLAHLQEEVSGWPVSFFQLKVVAHCWAVMPTTALSVLFSVIALREPSAKGFVASLCWAAVGFMGPPAVLTLTRSATRGRWAAAAGLFGALAIIGGFL